MTRKTVIASTVLYMICAVLWSGNFFLTWHVDETLTVSTVLYGLSAVCWIMAAVMNLIRIHRMKKTEE